MGEQRRYRPPQMRPASGEGQGQDREHHADEAAQPAVDLTRTFSAREVLRAKDFAHFTSNEMEQAPADDGGTGLGPGAAAQPEKDTRPGIPGRFAQDLPA